MGLSEAQTDRRPFCRRCSALLPSRASPNYPDHLADMPFPLPRWTEPVHASVASRSVLPSPLFRRVGIHDFTFEACSGFTRVTACQLAPSPFREVCHEASTCKVSSTYRSSATRPYRQLTGWVLPPSVICAVGAHVESRKGAGTRQQRPRFPSPLIEPDVRISRIRLSDGLQREAHGGVPRWT